MADSIGGAEGAKFGTGSKAGTRKSLATRSLIESDLLHLLAIRRATRAMHSSPKMQFAETETAKPTR